MLQDYQINRRIHLSFERHPKLKDASLEIKKYFEEIIKMTYQSLENEEKFDRIHSSSENLKYAIDVTIYDDFESIYKEAIKEIE